MLKHLDLFSGIGGFALAARMVGGIKTTQFVEIDPYCQKILAKNFPGVPIHDDITTFVAEPGRYDIVTGGFPCQDISSANPNGRGLEGERSGLFFELMRIVRQCRPRYLVLENVSALLSKHNGRDMGAVLWELSQSGFTAEWQVVSAASVGAPHLRERVFIVAYPRSRRYHRGRTGKTSVHGSEQNQASVRAFGATQAERSCQTVSHTHGTGREEFNIAAIPTKPGHDTRGITPDWNPWRTEPGILRVAHGIPNRVDRIRGLGNAVIPQVAAISLQRVLDLATQDQLSHEYH